MNQTSSNTFPLLKTKRLELRCLLMTDSKDILMLRTDKEVNKYIERSTSRTDKNGKEFIKRISKSRIENSVYYWVISFNENPKLMGTICLWNFNEDKSVAEVGYDLLTEHQGQGIMTEALKAVIKFGFNTAGFKVIEAFTHQDNIASKQLLIKNGFEERKDRVDNENANNIIFVKQND